MNPQNNVSIATLNQKRAPNQLLVEEALNDQNSTIQLSQTKMNELKIFQGDVIFIKGKKGKETLVIVLIDKKLEDEKIRMNKVVRKNLRVQLGDVVQIRPAGDVPNLTKIHILLIQDTIEGISGDLTKNFLIPYFKDAYRPVKKGDLFIVRGNFKTVEFKIVATQPKDYGIVAPNTMLYTEGEPINREDQQKLDGVWYDDIGGCQKQIALIQEVIQLTLRQPQLLKTLGMKPPRGILLHGPPGTGKSLIARAVASETGVLFFLINGAEITSGDSEKKLRRAFQEAEKQSPAIIFIDELDSIAPNKERIHSQVERRAVAQLLTLMDGVVQGKGQVIVMGATSRLDLIDPAFRRFGRFDKEIEIGLPDEIGRLEILRIHTKKMKLDKNVSLEAIAKDTYGFVGSDIAALCAESALQCLRQTTNMTSIKAEKINPQNLEIILTQEHFKYAMKTVIPASLRQTHAGVPYVK